MRIEIDKKTPTINHLYGHNRFGAFYLKSSATKLKEYITSCVGKRDDQDALGEKLSVLIEIHENWFNKDGTIKKKDLANREKFLIDSVFKALEIDDKRIWEHRMVKVQSDVEKAVVYIETFK